MRLQAIAIVLLLGCHGRSESTDKHETATPSEKAPKGRITEYGCDVTGDYPHLEIRDAVQAEAAAWQACADRIVNAKDPTTGTRVTSGDFQFSWTLQGGELIDTRLHSAGDGMSCAEPIVKRLQGTPAFSSNRVAGTLSCRIRFDDSR